MNKETCPVYAYYPSAIERCHIEVCNIYTSFLCDVKFIRLRRIEANGHSQVFKRPYTPYIRKDLGR